MEEAEARGESKGDAAAVEGDDTDSAVLAVIVRLTAGWPLAETAVEDMMKTVWLRVVARRMIGVVDVGINLESIGKNDGPREIKQSLVFKLLVLLTFLVCP